MAGEGRIKGSKNKKNDKFLLNRLKYMYGKDFHPIMRIADNCVVLQLKADKIPFESDEKVLALQKCNAEWSRMVEYVEPKLKAIEVRADLVVEVDPVDSIERVNTVLIEHGISIDDL